MCLQCVVDAEIILENFIPGWALMQAKNTKSDEWLYMEYAFVQINNPEVTFENKEFPKPININDDSIDDDLQNSFYSFSQWFQNEVLNQMSFFGSVRFYQACIKAGAPDDLFEIRYWIINRIGTQLYETKT